jgi:hypothetical protein
VKLKLGRNPSTADQNLAMIQLAITDDNILKYDAECRSSKNIPISGFICKFADLWWDFMQHKFH